MIQATQLRRGNIIRMGDDLFRVVEYKHLTPGNKRGMMQTKLKNLRSGAIVDHKFRSDDSVEKVVNAPSSPTRMAARYSSRTR